MSAIPERQRIPLEQGGTYAAGAAISANLDNVAAPGGGGRWRYMSRILVKLVLTLDNSSGGALTCERRKMYDAINSWHLSIPGWEMVRGTPRGSDVARQQEHVHRKIMGDAAAEIANGATGTFYLYYVFNLRDPRSMDYRYGELATPLLRGGRLQAQWCDGTGEFGGAGAGLTIDSAHIEVEGEFVTRDSLEVYPYPVVLGRGRMIQTPYNWPGQRVESDLHLVSEFAAGVAETPIAAADITHVQSTLDGQAVYGPNLSVQQILDSYNSLYIPDHAAQHPAHADGDTVLIPLLYPERPAQGFSFVRDAHPTINGIVATITGDLDPMPHWIRRGYRLESAESTLAKAYACNPGIRGRGELVARGNDGSLVSGSRAVQLVERGAPARVIARAS